MVMVKNYITSKLSNEKKNSNLYSHYYKDIQSNRIMPYKNYFKD